MFRKLFCLSIALYGSLSNLASDKSVEVVFFSSNNFSNSLSSSAAAEDCVGRYIFSESIGRTEDILSKVSSCLLYFSDEIKVIADALRKNNHHAALALKLNLDVMKEHQIREVFELTKDIRFANSIYSLTAIGFNDYREDTELISEKIREITACMRIIHSFEKSTFIQSSLYKC